MSKGQFHTLLKKSSYASVGVLLSRVLSACAVIIMSRVVGPANFGIYASLWAVIRVTLALSETGMTTGIKRDGARNYEYLPILLGNTLLAKIVIGIIALLFATLYYTAVVEFNSVHQSLTVPLVIIAFILFFIEPFFAVLQVRGQQAQIAVLQIGKNLLFLTGFIALAVKGSGLKTFVWFQAVLNCFFFIVVYFYSTGSLRVRFDLSQIAPQFFSSFVFGLSGVMYTTYTQLPVLALAHFGSIEEVGYFAVAYRLIELLFLTAAAASNNAFLPSLFRLYRSNRKDFVEICGRMQLFFFSLGVVVSSSLYVSAEPLILFLQGDEYRPAIQAVRIMSWAVMLNMGILAAGCSLTAAGRMRIKILLQLCVVAVVFLTSIFIIKPYGFLGASYTVCIMWGTLVILYYPYAGYKRLITSAGLFHLLLPSTLTIVAAVFTANLFYLPWVTKLTFFFLNAILVWLLTFLWFKKHPPILH
ncbi:MAG: oligosaccharide flippase family protein [Candidatus Electrothrix scaldis]|nr:MAG: oligosaccharide flippase family protein [Candidatus Electrothrix sp. GW3-3]